MKRGLFLEDELMVVPADAACDPITSTDFVPFSIKLFLPAHASTLLGSVYVC